MAECKLISFLVPENPGLGAGRTVGCTQCLTHQYQFGIGAPVGEGTLCPIGSIEKARDEAIARIREAGNG